MTETMCVSHLGPLSFRTLCLTHPQPTNPRNRNADALGRAGGAYIPPAKLRAMQQAITDKSSEAYQRMSWEALKKSINGLINKSNSSNIKNIVPELFAENLVRGRGLLCRSIMKAQAASPTFSPGEISPRLRNRFSLSNEMTPLAPFHQ